MTALLTDPARIDLPDIPEHGPERCGLVGEHPTMLEVFRLMTLASPTLAPVLLFGESGTGRETIARCLHRHSVLAEGPWLAFHCADHDAQSQDEGLFGEESLSDRGVVSRRPGAFDQARGGTLFLDDVAALAPAVQLKLLRAMQTPRIERRRHGDARASEIRVIASASRDLREALATSAFREDLYLRLAVVTLHVPRLADRGQDLLLLTAYFISTMARRGDSIARTVTGISTDAYAMLRAHRWRGNVRELKSVIEQAAQAARTDTIRLHDLPAEFRMATKEHDRLDTAPLPSLSELEARHIALVLRETDGVIHRAAEILGVHRNTLTRKIRQYGIQPVPHNER